MDTRWAHRLSLIAVAALLLAAACGSDDQEVAVSQEGPEAPSELAAALGPCPGPADGPDIDSVLTRPGAWYAVSETAAEVSEDPALPSTFFATAEYVGGDPELAELGRANAGPGAQFLASASTVELTVQADELAAEVYIKAEPTPEGTTVIYPLAFEADGTFAFIGECKTERYTVPLLDRFGPEAPSVVRGLVGADVAATRATLRIDEPEVPQETPTAPILNPQFSDPELLATLEMGELTLEPVPESWLGPYTLCPLVNAGWSPCFDLQATDAHESSALLYLDPGDPTVEFWLADANADLSRPLARVATVDLTEEVEAVVAAQDRGPIAVSLALPADTSVDDVVDRPGDAVAGVDVTARVTG